MSCDTTTLLLLQVLPTTLLAFLNPAVNMLWTNNPKSIASQPRANEMSQIFGFSYFSVKQIVYNPPEEHKSWMLGISQSRGQRNGNLVKLAVTESCASQKNFRLTNRRISRQLFEFSHVNNNMLLCVNPVTNVFSRSMDGSSDTTNPKTMSTRSNSTSLRALTSRLTPIYGGISTADINTLRQRFPSKRLQ